jgi:uncharacterized protein YukE
VDPGLLGLNLQQMRNLAAACQREAQQIHATVSRLNRTIASTWWRGPDADRFTQEWQGEHQRRALNAAVELERISDYLQRKANDQEAVSRY